MENSGFDVFDFAHGDEDLIEVDVDDTVPVEDDDDDASVFSEMEQSVGEGEGGLEAGPDMAHAVMNLHTDAVYVSAIHPTRPEVVVTGGGDDKAYLWTFDTATEGYTTTESRVLTSVELGGHSDTVTAVGFNFDGTIILTASYDGTVRTWDAATGELKLVMDGPEDIEWAQWHSKGNAIVAGSGDGTIWMWLAHDGQCVQVFAGHDGGVSAGCFTSDGKFVCSGGEDGSIRVWAPKTGACRHVFDNQLGHEALVSCLESNPNDPDLLLSGSIDGTVKLFQISGKRLLQTFVHSRPSESFSVECVGFSTHENSQKWIASGGMDSTLKIWDLTNGTLRGTCKHTSTVTDLKWHKSLPVIFASTLDGSICIWDARASLQMVELTGHSAQITNFSLQSAPHPTRGEIEVMVTAADDSTSRVFLLDVQDLM
eukprot:GSChrysophyteH1.ASY1.ANO1.1015.1 assembled CDS